MSKRDALEKEMVTLTSILLGKPNELEHQKAKRYEPEDMSPSGQKVSIMLLGKSRNIPRIPSSSKNSEEAGPMSPMLDVSGSERKV